MQKGIAWAIAIFVMGCGGGGSSGGPGGGGAAAVSCTISLGSSVADCQEYPESEATEAMQSCTGPSAGDAGGITALFANGPCPRTNAVGGCKVTVGSATATTWFYAPTTVQLVQQACSTDNGTFIAP